MASQERPPPPPRPPRRPADPDSSEPSPRQSFDLGKVDFDPRRLRLPHAAVVGFAIGIFFHACVIFAVLDDGSSAGGTAGSTTNPSGAENQPREEVTVPTPTATLDPRADRTDCNAIRTTGDYRSDAERAWFLANCTGQQQAAPTTTPPAAAPTATRTP